MTLRTYYNTALTTLESNCKNIDNVDNLNEYLRSSYDSNLTNISTGNYYESTEVKTYYTHLKATNGISAIAKSTFEDSFKSVMNTFGINDSVLDSEPSANSLINFFTALSAFCTFKLVKCSSSLVNTPQCVFIDNAINSGYTVPSSTILLSNSSRSDITKNIADYTAKILGNSMNSYVVKYNISVTTD